MKHSNDVPVRDAATIVLIRRDDVLPRVLMGQRGVNAAFMPSKYVFPGGAVDAADSTTDFATPLRPDVRKALLSLNDDGPDPEALAIAAVRELWEEAGQALAHTPSAAFPGWASGWPADAGPDLTPLHFFFRAVTPPGRPRRFDARFFLLEADALITDPNDFSKAEDELSHLRWLTLEEARKLPLPFITEIVLAEVEEILHEGAEGRAIPFFDHDAERSHVSFLE